MSDLDKARETSNIAMLNWRGKDGDMELLLTEDSPTNIGRDKENDIVLPGRKISKQHAILAWLEGAFVITDLNSANGTFVNEKRIKDPIPLQDGDRIDIAGFALHFTQSDSLREEMITEIFEIPQSKAVPDVSDLPPQPSESQIEYQPTKIFGGSPGEETAKVGDLDAQQGKLQIEHQETKLFDVSLSKVAAEVEELPAQPAENQIEYMETKVFEATTPDVAEKAIEFQPEPARVQMEVNYMNEAIPALMDQLHAVQITAETLENTWGDTRTRLKALAEQLDSVALTLTESEHKIADSGLVILLEKLATNPRDVTLLIELSQQAELISDLSKGFASQATALGEVTQTLSREIAQLPD